MRDEAVDGWKISQVEALIGLPRRDIQRACYDGSGGFGLVKPRNSTWGWRVYETTDLELLQPKGTWMRDDDKGVFACVDGLRPVIMLIEAVDAE